MKNISRYQVLVSLSLIASSALLAQSSTTNTTQSSDVVASSRVTAANATTPNDMLEGRIQTADYSQRNDLVNEVQQHLDAQKSEMKSVKHEGRHLDDQSRASFKTAWSDVEAREKELKSSLRDARNSSAADWETNRTKLAADYQAFENAEARAQSQAVGNTLNSSSWNSSGNATAPDYSTTGNRATDNATRMNSTATDSSGATTGGDNSQATSSTTTSRSANP